MLVDDVTIRLQGGHGGHGAVGFNRIKMHLGPAGANGGNGGSVYLEGVSDLNALMQFRFRKLIKAGVGEVGTKKLRDGAGGDDIFLKVPVGTVLHNLDTGKDQEITQVGEKILVARGGKGGKGNFVFRSSTNTSPQEYTRGSAGQSFEYRLELKMIADVGLIGLPNAGKSSLINELTHAAAKVGNYAFTTLEPNLGAYYGLILADIPGLIEGASAGKGLGTKFLRHIERTRTLFHLVSAESDDVVRDYQVIREELKKYNPALVEKEEFVFLSKTDMVSPDEVDDKVKQLKKAKIKAVPITVLDTDSLDALKKILAKIDKAKQAPVEEQ
ncbi:MAG: Obg family GTPase CgtA [Patescibacteria group bacterium]